MLVGALLELHSGSGSLVFIIVLILLLAAEGALHSLEAYCEKNGFKGLLQKLIREFMMMGLLSFSTYIATSAFYFSKENQWLVSFDFAHMVVFFVAITFIGQAVCLVGLVNSRSKVLLKYSAVSCEQLMSEYDEMESEAGWRWRLYHYGPLSLPFPGLRSKIQYKIIFHPNLISLII